MIRVTVEIIPFGMEAEKRVIGMAEIVNDGTGGREVGNYQAVVKNAMGENMHLVCVEGFPRLESDVWGLIYRVLKTPYGVGKRGRKPMTKEEFKAQLTKRFGNSFIGDMEKLLSTPYLHMSAVARKYGVSKQYLSKWVFPRIMNCDSSWRQIKSQNIQAFREEMRQNRLRPSEEENMNRFQKFWFSKRAVEEECKKRGFSVSSEQWVLLVNGKKVSVKSAFMSNLTPSRLDPYYGFRIPRCDFDVLVCHLVDINRFFIFKNTDLQGWNMLIKSPLLEQTKKAQERIDKHMDKWHVFEEKQA